MSRKNDAHGQKDVLDWRRNNTVSLVWRGVRQEAISN